QLCDITLIKFPERAVGVAQALYEATSKGDWACLELKATNDTDATDAQGCKAQTLGRLFDALGGSSNSVPISAHAISTPGILSQGAQLADGNGLAAVSCNLPTQFVPLSTAGQDLAMDPIPMRAAVRKTFAGSRAESG
ncbi:unnamed protein product, partial [Symbiodinium pilosum]